MEERQGWERPGWYLKEGTAPVPPYDYYGNYGSTKHEGNRYIELLSQEYSFDFSPHFDNVS